MRKLKKVLLAVGVAWVVGIAATQWVGADPLVRVGPHMKAYCRSIDNIELESNHTTHCIKVLDVRKVEDNVYHGIALMSNGSTYRFAAVWSDNFSYNLYYLDQEH